MKTKLEILKEDNKKEENLSKIKPDCRVLLLSHCLRPSKSCPAKFSKEGLACNDDCKIDCTVGRLRRLALKLGYKGVCIAAGGSMALRFVKNNKPQGIVAIACEKELEEGICAVKDIAEKNNDNMPRVIAVPLLTDGCIDTKVDEDEAERVIRL